MTRKILLLVSPCVIVCIITLAAINTSRTPKQSFEVYPTIIDLSTIDNGQHTVVINIKNTSLQRRRIIGAVDECQASCCFRSIDQSPVSIEPGETYEYKVTMLTFRPGDLEATFSIYLEDSQSKRFDILVRAHCTGLGNEK